MKGINNMSAIEWKFKLDLIFEYGVPLLIIIGFVILYLICVIADKIDKFKKKKEVIDKAVEYINQHWVIDDPVLFKNDLLEILEMIGDDK